MDLINRYVISTWIDSRKEYEVISSFNIKTAALFEYYYLIGQKRYQNLYFIDALKGKALKKWKQKQK